MNHNTGIAIVGDGLFKYSMRHGPDRRFQCGGRDAFIECQAVGHTLQSQGRDVVDINVGSIGIAELRRRAASNGGWGVAKVAHIDKVASGVYGDNLG